MDYAKDDVRSDLVIVHLLTRRAAMRWMRGPASIAAIVGAFGCGGRGSQQPGAEAVISALTAVQQRVLGFEAPTQDWSASTGTLGASTTASEGTRSLSVIPNGWTEIRSVQLASLGPVKSTLAYDVAVPQAPGWGETRMIIIIPSLGIYWQDLGSQPLTGMAPGSFHTVTFALPANVVTALGGSYSDLQLRVVINAPAFAAPYLVDHVDVASTSGGGGTPSPSASTLSVMVPRGLPLSSAFISATQRLQIDDRVTLADPSQRPTVSSLGQAGAELGAGVVANTNVTSVGNVTLRSAAHVLGAVTTAGQIITQNDVRIDGQRSTGATVAPQTTSWTVTFPSTAAATVIAGPDGPLTPVAPGAYGGLDVRSRGRVALRAGTYYLGYFNSEPQGQIQLDTSGGAIVIYVRDSFTYKGAFVSTAGPQGKVLVGYLGTQVAYLQAPFVGTMVAPNAFIQLARPDSGQHKGAWFGAQVEVFSDAKVGFLPFDIMSLVCPRGDSDNDGVSDCQDLCPKDPLKTDPGLCGCGIAETDTDRDGVPNCIDDFPNDPTKQHAGDCGGPGELAAAGTRCDDGVCRGVLTCDGQGQCGDPTRCAPIPGGACVAKFFGKKYYWFCPGPRSWDAAVAACRGVGTSLAQVDGAAEDTFLARNLPAGAATWIGANDRGADGEWRWSTVASDNGDRFWTGGAGGHRYYARYSAWAAGSPSNGSASCASIAPSGAWTGADCSTAAAFVCEVTTERTIIALDNPPGPGGATGIPISDPGSFADCHAESEVFGTLTEQQVEDAVNACNAACDPDPNAQACADACKSPFDAAPAGSTCAALTDQELESCRLTALAFPIHFCSTTTECTSPSICGTVSGFPNVKVCGTPVVGCPVANDPRFTGPCAETKLCEVDWQQSPPSSPTFTPTAFDPEQVFPAPDPEPSATDPYADLSTPCSGACSFAPDSPDHPWCRLGLADALGTRPDEQPGPSGSGNSDGPLVSFDFSPNLALHHTLELGPFGNPTLDIGAQAGITADAVIGPQIGGGATIHVLDAMAELGADQCSAHSSINLAVFGQNISLDGATGDFPLPFQQPSADDETACRQAFAKLTEAGNRAKKAFRDAVELLNQYKARVANSDPNDNFSQALCSQIATSPPRGFPAGNCATETPEQTINRFIEYYRRTVLGFGGADGAEGLAEAITNLTAHAFAFNQAFTLYEFQQDREDTIFQTQFFIGPVPVTLELDSTMHYGATIGGDVEFNTAGVIAGLMQLNQDDAAQRVAFVEVSGGPTAGAGLELFAGVGFGVNGFAAAIGIEGALNLGDVGIPAFAGAGIGLGSELDTRPPPPDVAGLVTGLNLVPAKRYVVDLRYAAGLNAELRNILAGTISAALKLKIAFFSKTWRKRIFQFDGICPGAIADIPANPKPPCDIPLLSLGGTTDVASSSFPWGAVRAEMPFPELAPLTTAAPQGSGTVSTAQVQELFYDSLCTCIGPPSTNPTHECFRNEDCCPSSPRCFSNPETGHNECTGCKAGGEVCNVDSDCCTGTSCFAGHCRFLGVCFSPCEDNHDCNALDTCDPGSHTCVGEDCPR
jgi:hypothetical protein